MVDPYAIVRRLTGHELISPKDARLLTEAVDGLIGEIGSKDARIAELEADVERLRRLVMAQSRAIHSPEALFRTGAVKVKALEWRGTESVWAKADALFGATYRITEYAGMEKPFKLETVGFVGPSGHYEWIDEAKAAAQADYERRILSTLTTEPAAPEGRQEAVRKLILDDVNVWLSALKAAMEAGG